MKYLCLQAKNPACRPKKPMKSCFFNHKTPIWDSKQTKSNRGAIALARIVMFQGNRFPTNTSPHRDEKSVIPNRDEMGGQRRFHGICASSIPMPQVSVIPANTSPAPTKPDSQIQLGWAKAESKTPPNTIDPAAIRTWRSSDTALRPRTTGRSATAHASENTTGNVHDVLESRLLKFATRTDCPGTGAADNVKRIPCVAIAILQKARGIQIIQRQVDRGRSVHLAKFCRRRTSISSISSPALIRRPSSAATMVLGSVFTIQSSVI